MAALVFVVSLFAIARSPLAVGIVFERLLTDGLVLLIWIIAACGWGAMLLRGIAGQSASQNAFLRFATSTALGMGAIGLLELCVGLIGLLGRTSAVVVLLPGIVFAVARVVGAARLRTSPSRPRIEPVDWLWLLLAPSLAIATI